MQIEVPRNREVSFEPVIVRKRQRRLSDLDQVVLSLSAKGLTTGEISAHLGEVYGAEVFKDTVTRITDRVDAVFPAAIVQTCIIHLIRGTFRYASRKYWDELAKALMDASHGVTETVRAAGFGRTEALRRFFFARFHVSPSEHQTRFSTTRADEQHR